MDARNELGRITAGVYFVNRVLRRLRSMRDSTTLPETYTLHDAYRTMNTHLAKLLTIQSDSRPQRDWRLDPRTNPGLRILHKDHPLQDSPIYSDR